MTGPRDRRWAGPLSDLGRVLRAEARTSAGRPCWRILPRGALVSMRIIGATGRYELRIARESRPKTDRERTRWEQEIHVFLSHLDAEGWDVVGEQDGEGGGVAVTFREPMPGKRAQQASMFPAGSAMEAGR